MKNPNPKRQIAKISDIQSIQLGKYIKEEGWEPNYILTDNNRKLSRVNIIGTIVGREEKSITIDDGNATISLKTFEVTNIFTGFDIGQTVLVIGRPREFNDEKYILAEIVQSVDPKWIEVRKKEFDTIEEEPEETKEEIIVDEIVVTDNFDKILEKIKELDKGMGVEMQNLISQGYDESAINKLLENGELFEISPGMLKILE